ncbi:caffeine-induced death protein cid2 [Diplodia corticola]|uniref:Caffeine-induced death protein cid2 n=1 Tax=Diplodia corticola TaxID=236234 RepID=A0A1J9RDQ1_9PEZI|nr:caffeine-induced death protein cid2 [Diplodia corticola]OJD38664.1 caffeine-induced death protein cid2 [Diplodia corticola]
MSKPYDRPELTPQFCFNQTALRDFLRLSRATIDDSITQNLNSLLTPASVGFDPSSTSTRSTLPPGTRRQIPATSCDYFKDRVLFPSWQMRSDVLSYCASVATSSDPDDPVSILREVEDAKVRERIVDERLDPYSARYFPKELRTEMLANVVRNERMVENIIRTRTWSLVGERCGGEARGFEDALNDWRKGQEGGPQ